MEKCVRCGKKIKDMLDIPNICYNCYKIEQHRIKGEKLIRRLSDSPLDRYMLLSEVTVQQNSFNFMLGDLFITPSGIIFIPYSTFMHMGTLSQVAGFLFGGALTAVGVSFLNLQNITGARTTAESVRDSDIDLSLEDRIRKHDASAIPRNGIKVIESNQNDKIIHIAHGDGIFEFVTSESTKHCLHKLNQFLEGTLQYPQDVDVGFPPARKLLLQMQNDTSVEQLTKIVNKILPQELYIYQLLASFDSLKVESRLAILKNITRISIRLANIFRRHLSDKKQMAIYLLVLSFICIPISLICSYLLINLYLKGEISSIYLLIPPILSLIGLTVGFIYSSVTRFNEIRILIRGLNT